MFALNADADWNACEPDRVYADGNVSHDSARIRVRSNIHALARTRT
jgi:hypothetical protein